MYHIYISGAHCCGSKMDFIQTVPCPSFKRFTSGGSFFVNYTLPKTLDRIRPSRVIDFRRILTPTFDNLKMVSFEWTAPGNDITYGQAIKYEVHCFNGKLEYFIDQGVLPPPKQYGDKQTLVLNAPVVNVPLFFTLSALDEVMIFVNTYIVLKSFHIFKMKKLFSGWQ
jgi:hypothetical protein